MSSGTVRETISSRGLTFDLVEREIRRRNFGVLSTISDDGKPHSVGVLYGVSSRDKPFALYLMTDRRTKKARNVARNPNVSFAIPLPRRFLTFAPPNCVQFQATAEIISFKDETSRDAFSGSLVLRKTLELEEAQREAVFIRIRPAHVIFTYGVGLSLFALMKNIGAASSRVEIPPSRLQALA